MALHDDVILRMVRQLVEALLRAAGLRRKKDLPAAEEAIGEGLKSLGITLELLKTVDAATLKGLVPDPVRRALLGAAIAELAACARERGDVARADALDDTSIELTLDIDASLLPNEVREALPPDMR